MINYFTIVMSNDRYAYYHVTHPRDENGNQINTNQFNIGKKWESKDKLFTKLINPAPQANFFTGIMGGFYVRECIMEEMMKYLAPNVFQRIKISIERVEERYEILNVLDIVDCIDKQKSNYSIIKDDFWAPREPG